MSCSSEPGERAAARVFAVFCTLLVSSAALGESTQPARPALLMAYPLAVEAGVRTEVTLRGLRLDAVTGVTVSGPTSDIPVTLKTREKSEPPGMLKPERAGDSHVVLEITPPESIGEAGEFQVTVETPDGKSDPIAVKVVPKGRVVVEREDNDGFRQATPFEIGQTLVGRMDRKQDVDVWRVEAEAGNRVTFSVVAARRGSLIDPVLTVYDAKGTPLAEVDDVEGRDAILTVALPSTGNYFVAVTDALEGEGPAHSYVIESAAK